jgi:hypothetical protein
MGTAARGRGVKRKRNSEFDKIAKLIPLRVTGDLTVDEARSVDEAARYDERSRKELESYTRAIAVLHEAASQPAPCESPIARGEGGSLWERIEPQLGPAGRMRPRGIEWIPTRYMAAACLALVVFAAAKETRQAVLPGPIAPNGNVQFAGNSSGGAVAAPRRAGQRVQLQIPIPAEFVRALMGEQMAIPEAGVVVVRIDRIIQKQLHLPDLNGVVVVQVQEGSLGHRSGLRIGDCIVAVNGQSVYAPRHLRELLSKPPADGEFRFDLIRHEPPAARGAEDAPPSSSLGPTGLELGPPPTFDVLPFPPSAPMWGPAGTTGSVYPV